MFGGSCPKFVALQSLACPHPESGLTDRDNRGHETYESPDADLDNELCY